MTTNITAVQTQIVEDAADTEDNNINTIKPIVQKMYYRLLSYITRILFNSSKYSQDQNSNILLSGVHSVKVFNGFW